MTSKYPGTTSLCSWANKLRNIYHIHIMVTHKMMSNFFSTIWGTIVPQKMLYWLRSLTIQQLWQRTGKSNMKKSLTCNKSLMSFWAWSTSCMFLMGHWLSIIFTLSSIHHLIWGVGFFFHGHGDDSLFYSDPRQLLVDDNRIYNSWS